MSREVGNIYTFLPVCPRRLDWSHFVELKQQWRVSLAALIRRARDLGCISDASYRRGNILLRGRLRHVELDTEPELCRPRNLRRAMDTASDSWPAQRIADELGLGAANLDQLLGHYEAPA